MPKSRFVQTAYNALVRPHLPLKLAVCSGVAVRFPRLLDSTDRFPDYKTELIDAIHTHIQTGESVDLVGLGRGVSTVHMLDAGADSVTAYEAAREMIEIARETLDMNRNLDASTVDIQHALVGEGIEVYGDASAAAAVSPHELSDADVLVMDCEGAEKGILASLGIYPETIIIETHPERGVSTKSVKHQVPDCYEVVSYPVETSTRDNKHILVATKTEFAGPSSSTQ